MREHISIPLARALQTLCARSPIALGECLWLLLLPCCALVILRYRRAAGKMLAIFFLCAAALYAILWLPIAQHACLPEPTARCDSAALDRLASALASDAESIKAELGDATPTLAWNATRRGVRVKYARYPEWMRMAGIAGVYFPWTGEVIVSALEPAWSIPFTACHEVAHALGYGREDEANFVAYQWCMASRDARDRYSATLIAMRYTLNALGDIDEARFRARLHALSPAVYADYRTLSGKRAASDSIAYARLVRYLLQYRMK